METSGCVIRSKHCGRKIKCGNVSKGYEWTLSWYLWGGAPQVHTCYSHLVASHAMLVRVSVKLSGDVETSMAERMEPLSLWLAGGREEGGSRQAEA